MTQLIPAHRAMFLLPFVALAGLQAPVTTPIGSPGWAQTIWWAHRRSGYTVPGVRRFDPMVRDRKKRQRDARTRQRTLDRRGG